MEDRINPLTHQQMKQLPLDIDTRALPTRFMANGQNLNIATGTLCSKGCNVMYHTVYWDRPDAFVNAVIKRLQKNNPGVRITKRQ